MRICTDHEVLRLASIGHVMLILLATWRSHAADNDTNQPTARPRIPNDLAFQVPRNQFEMGFPGGRFQLIPQPDRRGATLEICEPHRLGRANRFIQYKDLAVAEVIPLCAWLYQVTYVTERSLGLRRLDEGDVVAGRLPSVTAYAIPTNSLQRLYAFEFHALEATIRLDAIAQGANGGPTTAKGVVYYEIRTDPRSVTIFGPVEWTVKTGDLLPIRDGALKVLRIVPPDAKLNMRGWIELDPKPVTPAKGRHSKDNYPGPPHTARQQAEKPH